MKRMWIILALIAAICATGTGCSTILTQQESHELYGGNTPHSYSESEKPETDCAVSQPHVFSGTVRDFSLIMGPVLCEDFRKESGLALWALMGLPYGLLDLPFSLTADTLILPYTAYRQGVYGNIKEAGE